MGLLQKAQEQTTNTPTIRFNRFPEIRNRLYSIKDRIEFYPALFKEMVSLFSIEKGAFLLKEKDIFSLITTIGYDETTKNRLRITPKELDEYNKNSDINILKKYFSIREFVTMDFIEIIPFTQGDIAKGLLLISEYSTNSKPDKSELLQYADELGSLFQDNPLQRLKEVEITKNETKASITADLQKIKNAENRIIFIKMNMNGIISELRKEDKFTTNSTIKNSALKILKSFTRNMGNVYPLKNNDILLTIIDKKNSVNIMVIQQQISSAFKTIFSKKLAGIDLGFETLIWKDNSLDNILKNFIPDESN